MITVISGTNRKGSQTRKFAQLYVEFLQKNTNEAVNLIALEDISLDWIHPGMYKESEQSDSLRALQDQFIIPAEKFVLFATEYNGSFPGMLKLFIDALSIREYKATFSAKKVGLVGVASGRSGGLRALDQLSDVMQHMGGVVMPNKLPISLIKDLMDEHDNITDPAALSALEAHAVSLIQF